MSSLTLSTIQSLLQDKRIVLRITDESSVTPLSSKGFTASSNQFSPVPSGRIWKRDYHRLRRDQRWLKEKNEVEGLIDHITGGWVDQTRPNPAPEHVHGHEQEQDRDLVKAMTRMGIQEGHNDLVDAMQNMGISKNHDKEKVNGVMDGKENDDAGEGRGSQGIANDKASKWISTSTDIDWIIWELVRRLIILKKDKVNVTIIRRNRKFSRRYKVNKRDNLVKCQNAPNFFNSSSELLYYGRIFNKDIIETTEWTAESTGFGLPEHYYIPKSKWVNGQSLLDRLVWNPRIDVGFYEARKKMNQRKEQIQRSRQ
ncbi:uncharacterized protein IL334_004710 [Kwoniella shivajii]|uniref:Uncharacterized protein n=1 Tax=Kwoniella shivajii TaxID=564305 RepID=A0ABZ1D1Q1_9TREE|nr:hypothetical protein IL334_004710 [Kwoniella shivajii]